MLACRASTREDRVETKGRYYGLRKRGDKQFLGGSGNCSCPRGSTSGPGRVFRAFLPAGAPALPPREANPVRAAGLRRLLRRGTFERAPPPAHDAATDLSRRRGQQNHSRALAATNRRARSRRWRHGAAAPGVRRQLGAARPVGAGGILNAPRRSRAVPRGRCRRAGCGRGGRTSARWRWRVAGRSRCASRRDPRGGCRARRARRDRSA